jgi:hypothetical protein
MATQEQILCFAPGSLRESLEPKFYFRAESRLEEGVRAHVLYKISTAVCALKEAHACPWRRSDAGCTVSPEMMWTR